MKPSYLFLAPGFEEIEALATVDVIRRAGMPVVTVAVNETDIVAGAHNIPVEADTNIDSLSLDEMLDAQWVILPGGLPGADNLFASAKLCEALKARHAAGLSIAAICASPGVVLAPLGIVRDKKATAYPGFEELLEKGGATPTGLRVTIDGNITTGNGPSSAVPFALAIVEQTLGKDVAAQVAKGMLCD